MAVGYSAKVIMVGHRLLLRAWGLVDLWTLKRAFR